MCASFHQDLRQRHNQSLILAPQLRQSLKILQVAALDLRAVIQEELDNNPTLEDFSSETDSLDAAADASSDEAADNSNEEGRDASPPPVEDAASDSPESLDFSKEFDVLTKLGEDWRDFLTEGAGNQPHTSEDAEKRQHFFDSLVSETSLQEHLIRQAELLDTGPGVQDALRHLIGGLDERGFLTQSPSEAALQAGFSLQEGQEAARLLKTFEPAGIGAVDLPECLLLQLQNQGRNDALAARIVRDHFDLLTRRRIPDIARKTGVHLDEVQEAIEEIGRLDPAPGRKFAEDSNRVVVPDVTVEKDESEWVIRLNNDYIPRLRISSTYREMIARGAITKGERDYLRERMRSGKFIINSIEQRQQTIERITREILKVQREFFEEGVHKLHSLTMTQIAELVGVHETTVSRAIANKYIRTPHGVYEMKFFFTPGYENTKGESVSNKSVKEMINELVLDENKGIPLSDHELVTKLLERGIKIARRTVAKYREELGLLPSNLRRNYTT
jgi:RNA polymerase sigma-54 factor